LFANSTFLNQHDLFPNLKLGIGKPISSRVTSF